MLPKVIDMNQNGEVRAQEYINVGRVTEFRYCTKISNTAGALWDIPGLYDPGWGMVESQDAFVFVDNHDNQRGHGAGGDVITHKVYYALFQHYIGIEFVTLIANNCIYHCTT